MTHTLSVPQATPAASSKPRVKRAGGPRERAAKPGHAARRHRKRMAAQRSRRALRQTALSGRRSDERRPPSRLRFRVPTHFETPSEPRVKRPKAARTSGPNDRIGPRSRHLRQVLANRLPCLAASEPRPLTRGRQAGRAAGSPDFAAAPRMRSNACSFAVEDFLLADPTVGRRREEGGDRLGRGAGETLPSDRVLHPIGWHGRETGSTWVGKRGQGLTAFASHLAG